MKKILSLILVLLVLTPAILANGEEDKDKDSETGEEGKEIIEVEGTGIIEFVDVEGGCWRIVDKKTNKNYEPTNLKENYKQNGLEVEFEGKLVEEGIGSICQVGTLIRLTKIASKGKEAREKETLGLEKSERERERLTKGLQAIESLMESIKKGNASETSIQARLRSIERIKARLQENLTLEQKQLLKEKLKNQVEILKEVSELIENTQAKEKLKELSQKLDTETEETANIEEKIKNRNALLKFLIGSNKRAIEEFKKQLEQNRERIKELEQLKNQVSAEVWTILENQISSLAEENQRLEQFMKKESKRFSLFGWLSKG